LNISGSGSCSLALTQSFIGTFARARRGCRLASSVFALDNGWDVGAAFRGAPREHAVEYENE